MLVNLLFYFSSCDIRYTEGVQSLNWTKIMKTITEDPEEFFDNGGWSFLDPNSGDEAGDEDEESEDDAYNPSGSEDEDVDDSESEFDEESCVSEDDDADSEGMLSRHGSFPLYLPFIFYIC